MCTVNSLTIDSLKGGGTKFIWNITQSINQMNEWMNEWMNELRGGGQNSFETLTWFIWQSGIKLMK